MLSNLDHLAAFFVALVAAATLTPLVLALARRLGLFDLPNEVRKVHKRPIPRLGGLAVVPAFLAGAAAVALRGGSATDALVADGRLAWAFALGALAIFALGVFDDLRGAGAKLKFAVQTSVAVAMWFGGFRIDAVGLTADFSFALGALSLPITVLWIVGVVNAVNLIDGLDGLASGIALAAALVLFGAAVAGGGVLLALLTAALAGALVGFLFFNFNPARIFLGDSGSLSLGFVLAVGSIWSQHMATTTTAVSILPLFALGVPLLDTSLCIVRRVARGQSPFSPDREHLHHRLMALGLSHRDAVLVLYAVAAVFALAGLAMLDANPIHRAFALVIALGAGTLLVRRVGVFGERPARGEEVVSKARDAATLIRRSASLDSAWSAVAEVLPEIQCKEARLTVRVPGEDSDDKVLFWRGPAAPVGGSSDPLEIRMALGRRSRAQGELVILLDGAQEAPMLVAYRKALKSLRGALDEVATAQDAEAFLSHAQSAPPPWMSSPRRASSQVLVD